MIKQTVFNWHRKGPNYTIDMHIDLGRLDGNLKQAQYYLDSAVMKDMEPYMPKITGAFINLTKAKSAAIAGTGVVYAAAPPYGRFLYEGKTMVGAESGSPVARFGEKKVLVSEYGGKTMAKENLTYTTTFHPDVQAHWFDAAKKNHLKNWISLAKQVAGGGKHGR